MRTSKVISLAAFLALALLARLALQAPILATDLERNLRKRVFYEYDDSPLLFGNFAAFGDAFGGRGNLEAIQERQLEVYGPPFGVWDEAPVGRLAEAENAIGGYDPLEKIGERAKREAGDYYDFQNEDREEDRVEYHRKRRLYPLMVF